MKEDWQRPKKCPGTDDWSEEMGRVMLDADDRRIRELFPEFKRIVALPGQSIWEGPLQPFAQPYCVRLIWSLGVCGPSLRSAYSSPVVLVLDPPLNRRAQEPDRPIPHLYARPRPDLSPHLCLYWPLGREFHSTMYLAETVLPWAAEWLMYYELWHATGAWIGPEAPHGSTQPVPMDVSPKEAKVKTARNWNLPDDGVLHQQPYLLDRYHPLAA